MKLLEKLYYPDGNESDEFFVQVKIFGKLAYVGGFICSEITKEGYTTYHHNEPSESEEWVEIDTFIMNEDDEIEDREILKRLTVKLEEAIDEAY